MPTKLVSIVVKVVLLSSIVLINGCNTSSLEDTMPTDLSSTNLSSANNQQSQLGNETEPKVAVTELAPAQISVVQPGEAPAQLEHISDIEKLDLQIKLTRLLLARSRGRAERAKHQSELDEYLEARQQLQLQ